MSIGDSAGVDVSRVLASVAGVSFPGTVILADAIATAASGAMVALISLATYGGFVQSTGSWIQREVNGSPISCTIGGVACSADPVDGVAVSTGDAGVPTVGPVCGVFVPVDVRGMHILADILAADNEMISFLTAFISSHISINGSLVGLNGLCGSGGSGIGKIACLRAILWRIPHPIRFYNVDASCVTSWSVADHSFASFSCATCSPCPSSWPLRSPSS